MIQKFLGTKSYHPTTRANRERLWNAGLAAEAATQRERDRAQQLKAEREAAADGDGGVATSALAFMYKTPPGLAEAQEKARAAAEQKQQSAGESQDQQTPRHHSDPDRRRPTTMSELLAAHGIQDAPLAAAYVANLPAHAAVVKPFGKALRNVHCLRCGGIGHESNDRECPLNKDAPDDEATRQRPRAEDPLPGMRYRVKSADTAVFGGQMSDTEGHLNTMLEIPPEDAPEAAFLNSLSSKHKARLLRKIDKLERKEKKRKHKHKRRHHKSSKKSSSKRRRKDKSSESSRSSSSSSRSSSRSS
jgi:CBF1 interacting corepressor